MRNPRGVEFKGAKCLLYIDIYAPISKEPFASFSPRRAKHLQTFLKLDTFTFARWISLLIFLPFFLFFFYKGSKSAPKAPRWSFIERDPLTFHYSKSRLRSSKDKNEISVVVAEQHFNLAYVLSNPIYINPPRIAYPLDSRSKFFAIRVFAPLFLHPSSVYIL